ncbi:hypothetical protein [Microcoleus sp. herbarium12]|uniref:hypothetical protein n=1 Tax=Microcoleus sp. herbarium12 TaxID=3055437 RepID=UPI002FD6DE84
MKLGKGIDIPVEVRDRSGNLVQIVDAGEIFVSRLVEGVVVLADNARKGTVKAITFTVKDTFTVVEVTLHECNMRARLDKYEITGKVFAEYINRTATSNWTPEVKQKVMAAMNQDLTNQLEKLLGQPIDSKMFKDVEFFKS